MTTQSCPSCARAHQVSTLREGAEVPCACGAHFIVRASRAGVAPTHEAFSGLEATSVASPAVALPGYELERVLGRGGMGEVWLARQMSLGRKVAVKVLPPRLAKDPEFVRRFDKEATALATLNHPNIVQIIDRGVAGEHYFFVMEFVEGRSLREVVRELSPSEALRVALQVARALECAHDKDIIHRDLKPENVLLDARGHVKVADFGLAGIRRADSTALQLTATSVAMGTLNYMAPEQRRDAKSVDGRADLFSLGVVLYEMLTREVPVGRFRLPSERVPGLDPRVDTVVERLLENEPGARFASAHAVCEALEALVTNVSSSSPPSSGALQAVPVGMGARDRWYSGWRPVRTALAVLGAVVLVFWGLRSVLDGPIVLPWGQNSLVLGGRPVRVVPGPKVWPVNTNADLFVSSVVDELSDGRVRVGLDFVVGQENVNAHAGTWTLVDGQLHAMQGGNDASGGQLIPRAYLAHRYFSSDDFSAEAVMSAKPLGRGYPAEEPDAQHYAELSFRVTGLQVSIYAIPDVGMRLSWRYATVDGREVVGNSSQEVADLVQDETPMPQGPFRVKLQLKKKKNGVDVEAFINGAEEPFAHKFLEGFQGRSAKVAMGCRNLECTFDDVVVRGLQAQKGEDQPMAETRQE
ncbi:serine/threonine-protein kinase [Melittangium boletus]|uniref:Serine/threonine kinase Pkn10 n=1 Tax=Melittangium boletus DSM 14713 TaxID=1294270 RepID=A0A250IQL0_9BACT|nr:serine/threonine-protein kinase [Melittangium boletus]ATB34024.1 Serine/threonine kinase Pkn10 [Melittangium boletus DSM 14713]